ncbi:TPA: FKLRK protein [Staphylococcus aureus]|uniref:FKLRK protein n=1 Tax=Staphylococcus aureus TaxID=1280 RepID=UPI0013A6DEA0|nr:FKLRK protein [Staphylococcus aureus]NDQ52686.1 FKLRK protein [Staphylococcus aureus]HDZ3297790.1 FKLRK protein [Staphylococcus aureus]HDZ3344814.1 FKLRK protein [Staphylococcus aureus]HDZ3348488.1 FKLRK protein [Staphylococcus aureus]HDZ8639987.1 FKLRK protein [Staphylococcus aureus]
MRENFKLRKMKVGLVSVAITMLYIMTNGQAEASETSKTTGNQKVNTIQENKDVAQPVQNNKEANSDETKKNFVTLDPIKPGDQKVTGTTLPNQLILLSIDKKDVDSVETGNLNLVTANQDGKFEYDLNGRKIVHNQEIEVTSSSTEGLFDDEEDEEVEEATTEKAGAEEESTEAKATYTTPRYENAYKVPEKQLDKKNGHHQVWVEPITAGSGIIKGHTSVKGKVALSINNKFINLGDSTDVENRLTEDQGKTRYQGIWKHIDDKGYFEFDFKRKPYDNLKLNPDDNVSLTFLPNDEEEALKPIIFKTKVTSFDNIESAITSYNPKNVNKVTTLTNVKEDLVVEDIYGFEYKSEQGRGIPQNNSHSTKEIKGKTKFANAVVKVDSELGEGQEFPDLQVNEKGEFTFNSFDAGYRLYNGEKLNFTVVDPITGDLLSQGFVSKNIDVYESPEQKKEREFDEKLESIPAYYQLHGDKIIGFDTEGGVSTWFDAFDKKELEKVLRQY